MSEEQLKAFWEAIQADTTLQQKLQAVADDPDAIVAVAREAGFSISADELKKAQSELSEEQLEGVAGGVNCDPAAVDAAIQSNLDTFVFCFC